MANMTKKFPIANLGRNGQEKLSDVYRKGSGYSSGSQLVGCDPKVGHRGVFVGSRTAASIVC